MSDTPPRYHVRALLLVGIFLLSILIYFWLQGAFRP